MIKRGLIILRFLELGTAVGHYDLDEELHHKSVIYVDTKDAAVKELAHVYALNVPITGEIGQVLSGDLKVPATPERTTIFHSLGELFLR